MTAHTPGPWTIGPVSSEPAEPEIAIVTSIGLCPAVAIPMSDQGVTEANARLIAAAPLLLSEAEKAVAAMEKAGIGFNETGLRAAINSARGVAA